MIEKSQNYFAREYFELKGLGMQPSHFKEAVFKLDLPRCPKYRRKKELLSYFFLTWSSWRLGADYGCLAFAGGAVKHSACAPPCRRASYDCLCFDKHVCHAKPASDWDDGLVLPAQGPSQFESESVGSFWFYTANAMFGGPIAL